MNLKAIIKEWWFMVRTNPDSPEGLRHRADKLVASGVDSQNPMITALVKIAELKELREKETKK